MYNESTCNNGHEFTVFAEPFSSSVPNGHAGAKVNGDHRNGHASQNVTPIFEEWFHGKLSRKEVSNIDHKQRLSYNFVKTYFKNCSSPR